MNIIRWFKSMTLEGKIKRDISSISAPKGKLQVQLLEEKIDDEDAYRFNVTRSSIGSYQSLPVVLTRSQVQELTNSLSRELKHNSASF